jgi:subtilisin family serine protease
MSVLALVVLMSGSRGDAAPVAPSPPEEYRVKLRYSIPSPRDQHVVLYDQMIKHLQKLGFKYTPGPESDREDETKNYLEGTIPSAQARRILEYAHIASVLLTPPKLGAPAKPTDPVKVRLDLAKGFTLDTQRKLFNQTLDLLEDLGFHEGIAYDHEGYTRIVGTIPAIHLETLLKDLRTQPTGWLTPSIPQKDLPTPVRNVSPIQVIEVIPEPAGVKPIAPVPRPLGSEKDMEKVSRELRDLIAKGDQSRSIRMEVILSYSPAANDRTWLRRLDHASASFLLEGRLGPLVTARIRPAEVPELAKLSIVSVVRLPRPARPQLIPVKGSGADNSKALRGSGIYKLGVPKKGVRVAVVDGDFRGFRELLANRQLPANTRLVDLTAERTRELQPEPFAGDAQEVGHGTRCALALAQAMTGAAVDFVLIRIDPACPYQLQEVARYLNGEKYLSESITQRADELDYDRFQLRHRHADLLVERKVVLDNFSQEEADIARRKAYFKKLRELEKDEGAFAQRELRYINLRRAVLSLRGIEVVSSALVWYTGYPVDGSSPLTHFFDARSFKAALWFQSAGNTRGQAWTGLFRDDDGNGVMEFSAVTKPKAGHWTRELNFLAWQPFGQKQALDLPAKARLRITMQWREPHDPEFFRRGEDLYREPLAHLRLVLLKQRDPTGKSLSVDDMEEVANTPAYKDRYGLPQRLANEAASATYEQTLELTLLEAGRYALRVEGKAPRGIRPASVATLAALEKMGELRPRIFVEVVDEPSRAAGRPVFLDYQTDEGSLGMPADSRGVITVGAADGKRQPQAYSAPGPPMNLELLVKPDILVAEDGRLGPEGAIAFGANVATPYAAGLAARALFTGANQAVLRRKWTGGPNTILSVP